MKAERGIYNSATESITNKTWICSTRQPEEIGKQEEKSNKQNRVCLNINEGKKI